MPAVYPFSFSFRESVPTVDKDLPSGDPLDWNDGVRWRPAIFSLHCDDENDSNRALSTIN